MTQPRITHDHNAPVPSLQRPGAPSSVNLSEPERWLSIVGGAALALYGISLASIRGMLLATGGGALVWRGLSAHSPLYSVLGVNTASPVKARGAQIQNSVTVAKPVQDVYAFWHDFENLPRFMRHLQSVTTTGAGRSHWVANFTPSRVIEWDAETIEDRPNELIAWRSLSESTIQNTGSVRFTPAPGNRGTEVHVSIAYLPSAQHAGLFTATLLNAIPAQQIKDDLRRFKEMMEAGEVATTEGQPSGRV